MEGINDIGQARENPTPSADDVIAAHKQIIERAHAQRPEDLRRDADAVLRRGLLHRGRRGEAAGGQRVDPHEQCLRRGDRFRQGDERPERSEEVPGGLRLVRSPAPERRRIQGDGRCDRPRAVQARPGHVSHDKQRRQIAADASRSASRSLRKGSALPAVSGRWTTTKPDRPAKLEASARMRAIMAYEMGVAAGAPAPSAGGHEHVSETGRPDDLVGGAVSAAGVGRVGDRRLPRVPGSGGGVRTGERSCL